MFKINKRRQILLKARIYFHTRLGRIRTHKKREEMAMKCPFLGFEYEERRQCRSDFPDYQPELLYFHLRGLHDTQSLLSMILLKLLEKENK